MSLIDAEVKLRLGPELAGVLLSPEEFDAVEDYDDAYVYELVNGVLVVTPPVSEHERGPNDELGYMLRSYRDQHPEGKSLDLTLPESLVRTPNSRRRADRLIWAGLGRTPDVQRDTPTVAIEFVSAGKRNFQRDYLDKRDEYLAAGIQEYWIIDRFRRCMTVIRADQSQATELLIREQDIYQTPSLPGFDLPLAKLLAVADQLESAAKGD